MIEDIENLITPEQRKVLKKRLGEGLIIPCNEGLITALVDIEEYKQSKAVQGFIHKMPIQIHIRGGGAGAYEDWVTKYLSLEEAEFLRALLDFVISQVKEADA